MDLKEILKRTKPRSEKITVIRKPPSIATEDRPYSVEQDKQNYKIDTTLSPNEPLAKREQTVSKALAEPLAKREQSVSKALAKREQSVSKALAKNTTQIRLPLAEALAEPLAKREQSVSKALANEAEKLFGKEKQLLLYIFQKCQNIGSLETHFITTEELKNVLIVRANHLRNIIFRLVDKSFIEILETKNGKSSCRKFKMPKEIFQSFTLNATVSNALAKREQSVSKALAQPLAEALATFPSSSSSIINTTTTTGEEKYQKFNLSEEWLSMDIEPLANIGFSKNHLEQIAIQNALLPEIVQNSIYAFAFDLTENNKAKELKGTPINFFMGILRNGKPYVPPGNYKSPQDKAMRLYVEQQKTLEKRRAELEEQALVFAFQEWFESLSEEEKKEFTPKFMTYSEKHKPTETMAKKHFTEEIWMKKLKSIAGQKEENK